MENFQKILYISIIGCHRSEARIERGLEAVCLSIAQDIVTIIACSGPEAGIEKGRRQV
jgi:hypothetical protein